MRRVGKSLDEAVGTCACFTAICEEKESAN